MAILRMLVPPHERFGCAMTDTARARPVPLARVPGQHGAIPGFRVSGAGEETAGAAVCDTTKVSGATFGNVATTYPVCRVFRDIP